MKYQLVLQFPATSQSDFERLVALEQRLERESGDSSNVDGHDFGSGEFNIFVLTDDPMTAFEKAIAITKSEALNYDMRVAYRELSGENFVILGLRILQSLPFREVFCRWARAASSTTSLTISRPRRSLPIPPA